MFFWHQRVGGEDAWVEALSTHRQKIVAELHPAFVTVLDAHSSPEPSWGREDYAKLKYSGPYYSDWDAEDVSEAIPQFQKFLVRLQEDFNVNLASLRIYATGGRGFHLEVPEEVFMPKVPRTGTTSLPYIYKEMALELYVDTLDLRVYTGRKGRMWRVPGIVRKNGLYKVPLTVEEALHMTPELYQQVCAAPRAELERDAPAVSMPLAALFVKAQLKLGEAVKRQSRSAGDGALLARFKGQFPPSVERVMAGEGILPGVGFQKLSMQLAITANSLGKSAEQLIEACEGLVTNHSSDSARYNSPRKRREELRRMWEYTHDNPCYEFSAGGIRSLVGPETSTIDLDTSPAEEPGALSGEEVSPELQAEIDLASRGITGGVTVHRAGVYCRTQDGLKPLSNLGFCNPGMMRDVENPASVIGYDAELYVDGIRVPGRPLVAVDNFKGKAQMNTLALGYGCMFSGSDSQASAVQVLLRKAAEKEKRVIYIVSREGLDVVQNPLVTDQVKLETIWSAHDRVLSENSEVIYKYMPKLGATPTFRTDIHHAKALTNDPDTVEWLHAVFAMNSPLIVSQMVGWFVSCFHRQFYNHAYNQFPLLHPNGTAGSGKTATARMLGRMFHLTADPPMFGCSIAASKDYALKAAWTGSASVPCLLDEYKPSELGVVRHNYLLQHMRLLYNQGTGFSGGISRGAATSSFRDITQYSYSAPTAYIGESQEMQTAIVQRSLPVAFMRNSAEAHTPAFNRALLSSTHLMPRLGSALLSLSLHETVESRREALDPIFKDLRDRYDRSVHDRQVFNLSVVMAGLDFLDLTLTKVFGSEFKPDLFKLREALYVHKEEVAKAEMAEAAKVLNELSLISRLEGDGSEFQLREGFEYVIGDGHIDILMREAFVKYFSWSKRKGFTPLYTSADAFLSALSKYGPMTDRRCDDSPLKSSPQARVFRFNLEGLIEDGVEMFKSKSLA